MIYLNVPRWTSANAAANNASAALFPAAPQWEETLRSALADLLVRPAGRRIHAVATHRVEPNKPPIAAVFGEGELLIGRGETCGLMLPEAAIRREHARLKLAGDGIVLEDLGTSLGTFLGDRRLNAGVPEALPPGASFTIYPYTIQCRVEQLWEADARLDLAPSASGWWHWRDVPREQLIGCAAAVEPGAGVVWMGVEQHLVHEAVSGVLGVDRASAPGLLEADEGCLDYLLNSCLERCNARFGWPLRLDWQRWGAPALITPDTHGLLIHVSVRLRDANGAVRLFVPESVLAAIPRKAEAPLSDAFARVPVPCVAHLAAVELPASEAASLEEGDVVLIEISPLLVAARTALEWKCTATDDNFSTLRVDNPIERTSRLSTDTTTLLGEVPVTLQVILAHKEIPLGELRSFAAGTVLDLGRDESSPVQLAINGKVLGQGELVRIDNRLGVKVLGWNA